MDSNREHGPGDFAGYLQSIVQLEAIEKMTQTLDTELADSQKVMLDIKALFDSIPLGSINEDCATGPMKCENLNEFFDADSPKLLLPDMAENYTDVDLDAVILTMRDYAEELKKLVHPKHQPTNSLSSINTLNLEQYASSLDQLNKRLVNLKLNKKSDYSNRNPNLEIKLTQLCHDVNMFMQMVEAKTALSECNKNWTETRHDNNSLYYNNIIHKLLSGINEVMYLLQNKH